MANVLVVRLETRKPGRLEMLRRAADLQVPAVLPDGRGGLRNYRRGISTRKAWSASVGPRFTTDVWNDVIRMLLESRQDGGERLRFLRRFLLFILILGLSGTAAELILTQHTESVWQWTPLILIAMALATLAWNVTSPADAAARVLRVILILFLVSGVVGTILHWRGKMEFQAESNPKLSGWELFRKSSESKSPPALAPGVMIQLGLLGLAYQAAGKTRRSHET